MKLPKLTKMNFQHICPRVVTATRNLEGFALRQRRIAGDRPDLNPLSNKLSGVNERLDTIEQQLDEIAKASR